MALYEENNRNLQKIEATTFAAISWHERRDIQALLRDKIEIILPDALVISEEFTDWEDSSRRIDLLAVDKDQSLVVIELKRTEDGDISDLQAIRYAAMLSTMTFEQVVETYQKFLRERGFDADAREKLVRHFGGQHPTEDRFPADIRIVLVSGGFSKELTTAVLWLNDRELNISCIRLLPYVHESKVLLDVQQIIPLPEATEFQVRMRRKAQVERAATREQLDRAEKYQRFWQGLLEKAREQTPLHRSNSASTKNWLPMSRGGYALNYAFTKSGPCVELEIVGFEPEENLERFQKLFTQKAEVEKSYGTSLDWQQLDGRKSCRLQSVVSAGSLDDESTWEALQREMIERMIKLEAAVAPFIGNHFRDESAAPPLSGIDSK